MFESPLTSENEMTEFEKSVKKCGKSGMHNPLKSPERYLMWGDVFFQVAMQMR
jgi:1-pyrroline-5-carboxylate dehydrogenase